MKMSQTHLLHSQPPYLIFLMLGYSLYMRPLMYLLVRQLPDPDG